MDDPDIKALWLRPSTGKNVSIRREQIAEHLEKKGIHVRLVDTSGTDVLSSIKEAFSEDYDIIVGTVRIGLYIGYFLARILRKPFIGSVSDILEKQRDDLSPWTYRFIRFLEWEVLKRSDAVFFAHPTSYEEAQSRGIKGELARNSVDYEKFAQPEQDVVDEAYQHLIAAGVNPDNDIVTYTGSFITGGHFEAIVEAAKETPDWEFVFIGEERNVEISKLVSGVPNAYFLGSHEHALVPGFLHYSSAALCLMDNEIPLKVAEYGAAGLPTLGYPGKLKRVFSEEELIYVDPQPEAISEKLRKIASDTEFAQSHAANLREHAYENRWEDVAEAYYESIIYLTKNPREIISQ